MKIDFEKASFKDFENPVGMDAYERASYFNEFLDFLDGRGHLNYRLSGLTGCGPEVDLDIPGYGGRRSYVSLVSNDYLGFTQHPLVKKAATYGITNFGRGVIALRMIINVKPAVYANQRLNSSTAVFVVNYRTN